MCFIQLRFEFHSAPPALIDLPPPSVEVTFPGVGVGVMNLSEATENELLYVGFNQDYGGAAGGGTCVLPVSFLSVAVCEEEAGG